MAQGRVAVFDAHLHIIDPRFPLVASEGYLPEPFTVESYLAATAGIDVVGGAVVSGSFQAFDRTYLLDALERLGPTFVGVAQLDSATLPTGDLLVAEADGRLVAALSPASGATIADPFRPTDDVVALLRLRASRLHGGRRRGLAGRLGLRPAPRARAA